MLHNLIKKLTRILIANKFTFIGLTFILLSSITKPCASSITPQEYAEVLTAVSSGNIHYVKDVMPSRVSPNGLEGYYDTWSPLHYAASSGQDGMVDFLVNQGAALNKQDHEGKTPLHLALQSGQLTTARLLIEKGSSVNILSIDGAAVDMLTEQLTRVTAPNNTLQPDTKNAFKETYLALFRAGALVNDTVSIALITHIPEIIPQCIFHNPVTAKVFKQNSSTEQWASIKSTVVLLEKAARPEVKNILAGLKKQRLGRS